jgi:class 3 adenylate cyclase
MTESVGSLPLPDDPALAAWASALNDAGLWAYLLDARWCYVFATDDLVASWREAGAAAAAAIPIGAHIFSTEAVQFRATWLRGSHADPEFRRTHFLAAGRKVLASMPGGREEFRRVVDPAFVDLIDDLEPQALPPAWVGRSDWTFAGTEVGSTTLLVRIDDGSGRVAGFCQLLKPAAKMSQLVAAAATANAAHLERLRLVEQPDRRPAAILMADLEASSPLARRLSSAQYFAFGRRLVRTVDQCIVDAGGIVGRHTGDGIVAYFLAESAGGESAAAQVCIVAARSLRGILADVAARSEIQASDVSFRLGLHWGATLYMGRIYTAGRSEVTALGDEMNETARIEACAIDGRILASKSLIERLNRADAEAIGLATARLTYTPLADLATATEKARRDAPSIAVCDITVPTW